MFEIKHLKTLASLASTGSIRKAADALFVSQSALSHQLKDLEQRLNTPLFIRNTSPVQFTAEGQILLQLAQDILPKISHTLSQLKGQQSAQRQLKMAIACHACFQWLLPITTEFSNQFPELNIEFIEQIFPYQSDNNAAGEIDILFTDEKVLDDGFVYQALGKFEVVAVMAKHHNLADVDFVSAADFSQQTLLSYPVKPEYLDIFKLFLNKEINNTVKNEQNPDHPYRPKVIKQVANSHMILQMVAANMGIATLPDWLVNSLTKQSLVQTKRIGKSGIYKTLYARYQQECKLVDIIEQLIPQTMQAFTDLYSND